MFHIQNGVGDFQQAAKCAEYCPVLLPVTCTLHRVHECRNPRDIHYYLMELRHLKDLLYFMLNKWMSQFSQTSHIAYRARLLVLCSSKYENTFRLSRWSLRSTQISSKITSCATSLIQVLSIVFSQALRWCNPLWRRRCFSMTVVWHISRN